MAKLNGTQVDAGRMKLEVTDGGVEAGCLAVEPRRCGACGPSLR